MRIGTVLIVQESDAKVYIDDLDIRMNCRIIGNMTVRVNDSVLVELFPGGLHGVIVGVM